MLRNANEFCRSHKTICEREEKNTSATWVKGMKNDFMFESGTISNVDLRKYIKRKKTDVTKANQIKLRKWFGFKYSLVKWIQPNSSS